MDRQLAIVREEVDQVIASLLTSKGKESSSLTFWHRGEAVPNGAAFNLSQLASWLFDHQFPHSPRIVNELINKDKARVLLELGAELISSDAVALYELIKNGLDAGSPEILIDIQVVMQPSTRRALVRKWSSKTMTNKGVFIEDVRVGIDDSAPEEAVAAFLESISTVSCVEALRTLEEACAKYNYIQVVDSGKGMDDKLLDSCYLTIGTTNRLDQKQTLAKGERVPLGEKGIGRLAAMRLGHVIQVTSSVAEKSKEFSLRLDWRPIYEDPTLDLDDDALKFTPQVAGKKSRAHGTTILIRDLQSDWDLNKLRELSTFDLGKLADPFASSTASQFLIFKFQGIDANIVDVFESARLKSADAICAISYQAGVVEQEDYESEEDAETAASAGAKKRA